MQDYIWVTALRLLTALAVLIVPLPAFWLTGHLDRWDWSLLGVPDATAHQQDVYQYWDKSVDTFTLAVACIVALRWKDPLARRLAIATFAWRLAGVAIFMTTGRLDVLSSSPTSSSASSSSTCYSACSPGRTSCSGPAPTSSSPWPR